MGRWVRRRDCCLHAGLIEKMCAPLQPTMAVGWGKELQEGGERRTEVKKSGKLPTNLLRQNASVEEIANYVDSSNFVELPFFKKFYADVPVPWGNSLAKNASFPLSFPRPFPGEKGGWIGGGDVGRRSRKRIHERFFLLPLFSGGGEKGELVREKKERDSGGGG